MLYDYQKSARLLRLLHVKFNLRTKLEDMPAILKMYRMPIDFIVGLSLVRSSLRSSHSLIFHYFLSLHISDNVFFVRRLSCADVTFIVVLVHFFTPMHMKFPCSGTMPTFSNDRKMVAPL